MIIDKKPLRFRVRVEMNGKKAYAHGCYFPFTDLLIYENGQRFTGLPSDKSVSANKMVVGGVEWIDDPKHLPWYEPDKKKKKKAKR